MVSDPLTYRGIAAWYDLDLKELEWPDKRITHAGLRRFLIRIFLHQWYDRFPPKPDDGWELLWMGNLWASNEALLTWHKRIPKKLADHDRARVAAMLAKRHGTLSKTEKAALKWAKQRAI